MVKSTNAPWAVARLGRVEEQLKIALGEAMDITIDGCQVEAALPSQVSPELLRALSDLLDAIEREIARGIK